MDIRLVVIPHDDLLGINVAFVVLFFDQVLKLGDLCKTLLIKVGLLGIENVEVPEKKHLFCFLSHFILVDGHFPENNDGGLFAFADFAAVGPDLLECSIDPALEWIR